MEELDVDKTEKLLTTEEQLENGTPKPAPEEESNTRLYISCACINLLGGSQFGYLLMGVSSPMFTIWPCYYDLLEKNSTNPLLIATLFSMVSFGGGFGAVLAGAFGRKYGRRRTIMIGSSICAATSVTSAFAPTLALQMVSRTIAGLGVGMASASCPAYVSECAPIKRRGQFGSLFACSITLASLIAVIIGAIALGDGRNSNAVNFCANHKDNCMGVMAAVFLPAAVLGGLLFGLAFWVDESPVYLASQKAAENPATNKDAPKYADVLSKPRIIVLSVLIAASQQFSGINAVMFFLPRFMELAEFHHKMLGVIGVITWKCITICTVAWNFEKLGRRKLIIPAGVVMALCLIILTPVFTYIEDKTLKAVFSFILIATFLSGFDTGPGPLFWVLCTEIWPSHLSALAFSPINGLLYWMAVVVTFGFHPIEHLMGKSVFLIFGIPGLLIALGLYLMLPETKGRTKDDISRQLSEGSWLVFRNPEGKEVCEATGGKVDEDDLEMVEASQLGPSP